MIQYKAPGLCPICGHSLYVSKLNCMNCNTTLEGQFIPCKFCQLPPDQLEFIEVFIKCRGNIKDVEKELGISYPTVRGRLDSAIQALGYKVDGSDLQEERENRKEILDALDRGEITSQEAASRLKKAGK
ncbi:DUF2089 domain-containing protein [Dehalobacter sp. 4CP]|uniref:DUF2089 domain-containing protein n=1 Tax=Dehalobacter sp. CP TaxID=2594474 RepID=UPI0039EC1C2C